MVIFNVSSPCFHKAKHRFQPHVTDLLNPSPLPYSLFTLLHPALCPGRLTCVGCIIKLPCPLAAGWILSMRDPGRRPEVQGKYGKLTVLHGPLPAGLLRVDRRVTCIFLSKTTAPIRWPDQVSTQLISWLQVLVTAPSLHFFK